MLAAWVPTSAGMTLGAAALNRLLVSQHQPGSSKRAHGGRAKYSRHVGTDLDVLELSGWTARRTMGKAAGRITYDPGGNVAAVLMHERRNQFDGRPTDPDTISSYSAYFGTYNVDLANGMIRHQVTGSLDADASGELLVLGFTTMRDGMPVIRRLEWRRVATPSERISPLQNSLLRIGRCLDGKRRLMFATGHRNRSTSERWRLRPPKRRRSHRS